MVYYYILWYMMLIKIKKYVKYYDQSSFILNVKRKIMLWLMWTVSVNDYSNPEVNTKMHLTRTSFRVRHEPGLNESSSLSTLCVTLIRQPLPSNPSMTDVLYEKPPMEGNFLNTFPNFIGYPNFMRLSCHLCRRMFHFCVLKYF